MADVVEGMGLMECRKAEKPKRRNLEPEAGNAAEA
jgi:hypothetical protein